MSVKEKAIEGFLFGAGISSVVILLGIFLLLAATGLKAFSAITPIEFLLGTEWNPTAYGTPRWGIAGLMMGTLMVTLPAGIAAAVYLAEIAKPRARELLKPAVEMIAGVPSVVLGLVAIFFLSPLVARVFGLTSGLNGITAALVVGLMALPTVASISEDVLTALPGDFREASLALGATRWQTIRMVLLPAARSGILAAAMLAMGRAVGETMAVLMVAGNARAFPLSLFDPVRPMTANIAIEIKEVVQGSLHFHALFAIGLVLFLFTLLVNALADAAIERQRGRHRW